MKKYRNILNVVAILIIATGICHLFAYLFEQPLICKWLVTTGLSLTSIAFAIMAKITFRTQKLTKIQ